MPPRLPCLGAFATDATSQLDVLGHDGHSFSVDGAQVGVFEQSENIHGTGEDQKKKVFTTNGTRFPPNSSRDLRSDAHQSQIIGGDADEDHAQIIGGMYPPPSRVSAPLSRTMCNRPAA